MRILVTGHEGFLGNNLLGKLKEKGHFTVGIDKKGQLERVLPNKPHVDIQGDVRDYNLLREAISENEIQGVYHLASWAIASTCAKDPQTTFDINVMGAVKLFEACRTVGSDIEKIVVSTSDKAYGNAPVPYTEESPLQPQFAYDTSKTCQQQVALCYHRNYDLPVSVVSCSNIFGPGDLNISRVIPGSITRLARGEPMRLWKDSENHVREFVYVDDASNAFTTVFEKGNMGEVYCCGGTEHLTVRELMERICNAMGKDPEESIKVKERPFHLREIEEQYIDATKLKALGWQPQVSLDEGLKRSIEHYTGLVKEGSKFIE